MPLRAPHCHKQTHPPTFRFDKQQGRAIAQWNNMAKKMLIDATHPEETRVVVVDGNRVEEFDFESENKRQLAGNIYLAKVTRVEPSLQAAFVDYGGNRHGFLAFSEIHPDYYQIPVADREKLLAEEAEFARQQAEEEEKAKSRRRSRGRGRAKAQAEAATDEDALATREPEDAIGGMDVIDLEADADTVAEEGLSPMETVAETPVEEPAQEAAVEADAQASDETADEVSDEADAQASDEASDEAESEAHEDEDDDKLDASEKDEHIEDVADEDVTEEVRAPRKRRPKKYKIQEVIKVRQILLVQVVKEERGNKGAALTTYLSLAGRYCVLMPNTARGGGISRKITNAADRKKLKAIAGEIEVPQGAGLIVRTAGAKRTKTEIKRDYEYLLRLWEQIRELTLKSIAPAKIYEEGNLIKRSIRDLYNRDIDEVLVEGERGYRTAKDFMKMIMPSHARNVKHYTESMPLFARYQVEGYLAGMFNPTVQLRSGGYIVIGVTEALVAIDVNSGRATKEGSIEETALKTNLEAAEEVARQLRLRDLAGLIVIDFIDMEERKNNNAVEKRLKDKLKTDRARIQVGRISGFGLLEMSRQRLRPGMIEATTQPCAHCHGTGLVRSDDNLALSILRQLEEEGTRKRSREVLLKAPVGIVNFLINSKREHVAQIEARYGMAVRIEADPFLVSPDFTIEKFKTATRPVTEPDKAVISGSSALMSEIDEAVEEDVSEVDASDGEEAPKPKKRRRRRRRRRSSGGGEGENGQAEAQAEAGAEEKPAEEAAEKPEETAAEAEAPEAEAKPRRARRSRKPKAAAEPAGEAAAEAGTEAPVEAAEAAEEAARPKRVTRTRKSTAKSAKSAAKTDGEGTAEGAEGAEEAAEKPAPKPRKRAPRKSAAKTSETAGEAGEAPQTEAAEEAPAPEEKPKRAPRKRTAKKPAKAAEKPAEAAPEAAPEAAAEPAPEPAVAAAEPEAAPAETAPEPEAPAKPKKKGWWSLGR